MKSAGGGGGDFLDGLDKGFIVTLSTAYTGGRGSRDDLANYTVEGIEIHFSQAVLLPGGVLGGAVLTISFATAIPWADAGTEGTDGYIPGFNTEWLGGGTPPAGGASNEAGAFDEDMLLFRANAAGKGALKSLLGLEKVTPPSGQAMTEPEGLRSVALGDEGDNTIDLSGQSGGQTGSQGGGQGGDWVVFGGGGNDTITLGSGTPPAGGVPPAGGTEDVIYRLNYDGATFTNTDGSDEVDGFTLKTDSLTFIDTDGTPATTAEVLGGLMAAFDVNDEGNYAGIRLILGSGNDSATLTITFATPIDKDALTPAPANLSDIETALIGELFGAGNISVEGSLPVELL